MHCPTHGTTTATLPAIGHDHEDIDIVCPECRRLWTDRAEVYELPPRDTDASDGAAEPRPR